jgi:lipid II:glycine glycyltransferase (peptidoglycan interpeptide bridge formation enzyme)
MTKEHETQVALITAHTHFTEIAIKDDEFLIDHLNYYEKVKAYAERNNIQLSTINPHEIINSILKRSKVADYRTDIFNDDVSIHNDDSGVVSDL